MPHVATKPVFCNHLPVGLNVLSPHFASRHRTLLPLLYYQSGPNNNNRNSKGETEIFAWAKMKAVSGRLIMACFLPASGMIPACFRPAFGVLSICFRPAIGLLSACFRLTYGLLLACFWPAFVLIRLAFSLLAASFRPASCLQSACFRLVL